MSYSFIDYPASGPDQGLVKDISPMDIPPGRPAYEITQSLKKLYDKIVSLPGSGPNQDALNALSGGADTFPYFTGPTTMALASLSPFMRSVLDDTTAVGARATLGLVIGNTVQAYHPTLLSLAQLGYPAIGLPYFTTGGAASLTTFTSGQVFYATSSVTIAAGSPDTAGLVDKSTTQTITGTKNFSAITATSYTGGASLTGTPTAPTASAGTATTQIATTNFVGTAITAHGPADKNYHHAQGTPASVWTVTHNLGKYPAVSVIDSTGNELYPAIYHASLNQVQISFNGSTSGTAEFN